MPTELETELLEMAAAERRRTRQPSPAADELPELEPGMLLSASAQGEVRAAQRQARTPESMAYLFESSSHGGPSRELIEEMMGVALSAETPEQTPVELHATVELSGPDADWVREEIERGHNPNVSMGARVASAEPNANGDIFPAEALAGLFMSHEARAQAELAGVSDLIAEGAGIEFSDDMGSVHVDSRSGNYGWHRGPSGGGQGRVVSQRGEDGQWTSTVSRQASGRGIRPVAASHGPVSPRRTYPTTRPSEGVRSLSRGSEAPLDRSSIPSAIERIAGKGPFDD